MGTAWWYLRTRAKLLFGKSVRASYSQFGEDIIADSLLRGVARGVYVDVGAFDPVLYSNTYHFYRNGWRGLVIDPNASLQKKFAIMRPRDTFIPMGIAAAAETRTYYEFSDRAYNTFDENEKEAYLKGNSSLRLVRTHEIPLAPLSAVLRERGITSVDFLSIDAQGLDLQALESMGDLRPRVIAVEASVDLREPESSGLYRFLRGRNYELAGVAGLTLLFIRRK